MKLRPAFLLAASLAAAVASAANPVGTWTGKFLIKMPPVPASATPQQKQMMTKMMAQVKAGRITMSLKANKTYTAKITGMPMVPNGGNETGTWSQTGNAVTIKDNKRPNNPQKLTMSADGKKMTLLLPNGQGSVVFTR